MSDDGVEAILDGYDFARNLFPEEVNEAYDYWLELREHIFAGGVIGGILDSDEERSLFLSCYDLPEEEWTVEQKGVWERLRDLAAESFEVEPEKLSLLGHAISSLTAPENLGKDEIPRKTGKEEEL